jgi:1,4-dihydroxy-2-naphthoate octaprenyltransferase
LLGGIVSACVFTAITYQSPWQLLFLLTVPLFLKNGFSVQQKQAFELDPYLKQLALSTLLFVLLFGTGLVLA